MPPTYSNNTLGAQVVQDIVNSKGIENIKVYDNDGEYYLTKGDTVFNHGNFEKITVDIDLLALSHQFGGIKT